ncbi:MAG: hypothetical protein IM638_10875 [Bacteroidetes bacterium]|nr:hypothetical protein [Bacteroidota bacterium]
MDYEYFSTTGEKLSHAEVASLARYKRRFYESGNLLREELLEKEQLKRIVYYLDSNEYSEIVKKHTKMYKNIPFIIHLPLLDYTRGIQVKKIIEFDENGKEIEYFDLYIAEDENEIAACYFSALGIPLFSTKFLYNSDKDLIYELKYDFSGNLDSGYDYINDKVIASLESVEIMNKEKYNKFSVL